MQRSQSWIIPTVMSPEKGGPVYNQLRANFAYTRRMIQRHPFRWINDNWDFERPALAWLLYAMWWRFKLNDKHNFRKKWRDIRAN